MDYKNAKALFEQYLDGYDRNDDKVRLKIVHTYGVVKQSEEIAKRMGLSEEDTELARMIALLHDIGTGCRIWLIFKKTACIETNDQHSKKDSQYMQFLFLCDCPCGLPDFQIRVEKHSSDGHSV